MTDRMGGSFVGFCAVWLEKNRLIKNYKIKIYIRTEFNLCMGTLAYTLHHFNLLKI